MATARIKGNGYEIRVFAYRDIYGKKVEKSKIWYNTENLTGKKLEKELDRQKVLFEEEVKNKNSPNSDIRFYDFSNEWLKEYAEIKLAHKTIGRYKEYLSRINTAIGHIKLKELTPFHLTKFYNNLAENGINLRNKGKLSPKTILEHHRVISSILSKAVEWSLLETNVALRKGVRPSGGCKERAYLDEVQIKKLLCFLDDEPIQYRTMISILIHTGMRRGELCGLEWKDIDLDGNKINIVRSSQCIGSGQIITKDPKTKAGIRNFTINQTTCQLLEKYKEWQDEQKERLGDRWIENDRLFTQWNGSPIYPDTITDWFAKFIKRSDLPYVTLHSLRHTNATLLVAWGTDICTISKRLGHANTATTLNIYSHALDSKDIEAAEKLESALCLS